MSLPLEKLLKETLGDLENLSPEKIQTLLREAFQTFSMLKEKSNSTDPKEREEAYKQAMSLKETLLAQSDELGRMANIDPADLAVLAENKEIFKSDTWTELSSAKKELEEFRDQLGATEKKTAPPHNKRPKPIIIPG